jgi:hypothetical protein
MVKSLDKIHETKTTVDREEIIKGLRNDAARNVRNNPTRRRDP